MEDLHIDLSSWLQSLNDEDNNTIIDVLDNIEVTIGPFVSDGNKTIIELLLKEYTKNYNNLKESIFRDKIQKPKR